MNQVEPVYIVTENASGVFWMAVLWWSLGVAGAAIGVWLLIGFARGIRRDPLASAFSKLARRRLLSAEERAELKAIAARTGVPAAALLISAGARAEAAKRSARSD